MNALAVPLEVVVADADGFLVSSVNGGHNSRVTQTRINLFAVSQLLRQVRREIKEDELQ